MLRRFATLSVVMLLGLPALGLAQVTPAGGIAIGDDTQPATSRVGAVIFYDYTFQNAPKATDGQNPDAIHTNSFNLARAYLNVTGNISHLLSYRITPDINSTRFAVAAEAGNNLGGSLVFRLKYAYAQVALSDWTGKWTGTYVRLGTQQTPFIDYQESIYRYRFQGTVFAERDGKMSSADTGVTFHSDLPNNYGDFHFGVYNGENYNKGEVNNQKAFMFRGTIRPMPTAGALLRTLRVTGFAVRDNVLKGAPRNRAMGNVVVEQRHYNINFDYLKTTDQASLTAAKIKQDGYSLFVTPFFKEKGNGWEMLIRYDSVRPDIDANSKRRQNRAIVGLAYWFPHPGGTGTSAIMLDYQQQTIKNPAAATPKSQILFVHGLINF